MRCDNGEHNWNYWPMYVHCSFCGLGLPKSWMHMLGRPLPYKTIG